MLLLFGLAVASTADAAPAGEPPAGRVDRLMVVDCLLPSQIRRLGRMTYAAARKAIKTSALDCEARGGEYVAYDRASHATTLKVWLPLAEEGDPQAQTYVGEAFEKGRGVAPDYATAADWYLRAAEQGYARAAINLGNLFEQGLGLERDPELALFWYRRAAGGEGIESPLEAKAPPPAQIILIEPEVRQRGVSVNAAGSSEIDTGNLLVIGQVETDARIAGVRVNDVDSRLLAGNMFRANVSAPDGWLRITAILDGNHETELAVALSEDAERSPARTPAAPLGATVGTGPTAGARYHALVIGNNRYLSLPILDTAVNDARAVADALMDAYAFEVKLMIDADRYAILSALNDMRELLSSEDRLLVYYAGHGELDRVNRRGHWLPVDAEPDSPANWISNVAITDMLNIIPSNQLLVIADSCYSGMMSRSALGVISAGADGDRRERLLADLAGARTRTALTSGGVAPVLDSGGGNHSVFAAELLDALERNQGAMTGYELYQALAPRVSQAVRGVGFVQDPEYAPLSFAGHEAGDFVFYKSPQKEKPNEET